jgi:SAM-dependent methyltransferase
LVVSEEVREVNARAYDAPMGDELDSLLDSQPLQSVACVTYYRGRAPEYGVTRPVHEIHGAGLVTALDAFGPRGDVLELSCGSGIWIRPLLKHATHLTAVDASAKSLAVAAWRARDAGVEDRVRFVESDVFGWQPDRRYGVVFFSTLLSWIPPHRFDRFWKLIAACLEPAGRVFFIGQLLAAVGEEDAIPEALAPLVERSLHDKEDDRVMVFYEPDELRSRLAKLDWDVAIHPVTRRLFYATGQRATPPHTTATS